MGSIIPFGPQDVTELFPLEIGVAVQGTANLEKVEIELEGQRRMLRSIKRQAAKARRYRRLREELRAEPNKVPAGISKSEWVERLINEEITESKGFDLVVMGRQEGPDCYCYINNLLRKAQGVRSGVVTAPSGDRLR